MTIETLFHYISQDRRRALIQGQELPNRTHGAALFADISGFTPLTERLRDLFGARRGAEELTRQLDIIYGALIREVERYQGSVVGFAGDAITCWFDEAEGEATARAVACAIALQQAMQPFGALILPNGTTTALALKVAVTTGAARRFVVGDSDIYRMDALAGATIARTATAEHCAEQGDILVDTPTVEALGARLHVSEWRVDEASGERFAVVAGSHGVQSGTLCEPKPTALDSIKAAETLRPWLHRAVYEREMSGQGSFLTEFRPTVALFVRFVGIDYDSEEAEDQLDSFICQTQAIVMRYDGTFLQITIGDKGSYGLIAFGALTTHEDDLRRAIRAALDIRLMAEEWPFLQPLQMGLAQGVMRVGAYGGPTRRTYSVMGDEANLAARLMQAAAPGEILLSGRAHPFVARDFIFQARPPLYLKGKAEPQAVFVVMGGAETQTMRLPEPSYTLPLVGRTKELEIINEKLEMALTGKAQIIGIVAEAGLGKSRLVAEVIRLARQKGFVGYGGAAQSDALYTPYFAWKPIWSLFLGVNPKHSWTQQVALLISKIKEMVPGRAVAVPLLSPLLDLPMDDNDFTQMLTPHTRKSTLHALLEDCLKVAARARRILLVIEDMHWLDALSYNLLEGLARAITPLPICIVLAYRPQPLRPLSLEKLPHFSQITLNELSATECEQFIQAKLAHHYALEGETVSPLLMETLMTRAQGNPFYLEELLNYLHDRGLDPRDPTALAHIELPDTLHALILSRLDPLTERAKTTLRVASIVGRLFRADWLTGYYPTLGDPPQVKADLHELHILDITPLDSPEPELAYLFKHIVTHEVTYESLPYARRAQLHEQLAQYLEMQVATGATRLPGVLDALAYHYGESSNKAKQKEYFQLAGAAAQQAYAHETALQYYDRLLPLLSDPYEQIDLHLQWGSVLELTGDMAAAESHYRAALTFAMPHEAHMARSQLALGKLQSALGQHNVALEWLTQARAGWTKAGNAIGLGQTLVALGLVCQSLGRYAEARAHFEAGLALADAQTQATAYRGLAILAAIEGDNLRARQLEEQNLALYRQVGDKEGVAASSLHLGITTMLEGNMGAAQTLFEESLTIFQQIGGKSGTALALSKLGELALHQGQPSRAWELYEESLLLYRQTGEKPGIALALSHLAEVASWQGDTVTAQALYQESLTLRREMGDKRGQAATLSDLAGIWLLKGDYTTARKLREESLTLYRQLNDKKGFAWELGELAYVALCQADYVTAEKWYQASLSMWRELGDTRGEEELLNDLGLLAWCQGDNEEARSLYEASLSIQVELGHQLGLLYSLIGLALVAYRAEAHEQAALLLAFIERQRAEMQLRLNPLEHRLCHEALAALRIRLGEVAFQAAWARGQAMTLAEVLTLNL